MREDIGKALPSGLVVPRHNEKGHFYQVGEVVYPSVTGRLQILKDEGLINYKMNRAIEYVFAHFKEFTDANIMAHLDTASRVSVDILTDAGGIGTDIHNYREAIFRDWIKTGERPKDFLAYIPADREDIRAISALRALSKFCDETGYIPVDTELLVFSHKLKVAGTLDDIGIMRKIHREGNKDCVHNEIMDEVKGNVHCVKCDRKWRYEFVLMDLKTSNQFKDHYFFQVALYYQMFKELTGLKPERCFILKVSKEDGSYKMEDLYKPSLLASYAKSMLKTHEGITTIKDLRKDNQKIVGEKIEL